MRTKMKNREVSFELIRLIACFIVICLHTSSWYIVDGQIDYSNLLIKCFLQDAVPLFWFIMGYFLFVRNKTFLEILKKLCYKWYYPHLS